MKTSYVVIAPMFREIKQFVRFVASEAELGLRDSILKAKAEHAADFVLPVGWRDLNIQEREEMAQGLIDRRDRNGQLAFMYLKYVTFCDLLKERNRVEGVAWKVPDFVEYRIHMGPYQKELLKPATRT